MLLAVKVIGLVAYLVGIPFAAKEAKVFLDCGGEHGNVKPFVYAVFWPVVIVVGAAWSLSLHLSDWVSK